MKISVVVVTFNRLTLLQECLDAIKNQTFPIHRIVIVDNASTDGTKEYLKELSADDSYKIVSCEKNIGGSGGFSLGIKEAIIDGAEYVWIMDDDTIPTSCALSKLTEQITDNTGFVCSKVNWIDGKSHLMNKPGGYKMLPGKNKITCEVCSFVSVLISAKAIKEVGLPYKDFFIWFDDIEYTLRISKAGYDNFFSPESIVIHKSKLNYYPSVDKAPLEMAPRFYYQTRNTWFVRSLSINNKIEYYICWLNKLRVYKHRINKRPKSERKVFWEACKRGMIDGLKFHPQIEYIEQK